jgi:hypothetical protein
MNCPHFRRSHTDKKSGCISKFLEKALGVIQDSKRLEEEVVAYDDIGSWLDEVAKMSNGRVRFCAAI